MESPTVQRLLATLKQLRLQSGLTQEEFSEKSGISYKYYQAVEAGRKRDLRLSTLERLAKAHDIELWQLFFSATGKAKAKAPAVRKAAKKKP